jgi:YVTN family beta-propeller protein
MGGPGTPPSLLTDVGARPIDLAIYENATPNTDKVYITNMEDNSISVVEVTQTGGNLSIVSNNTINSTGAFPIDAPIGVEIVQVAANESKVYVANAGNNTITVIDVDTDSVIKTIDLN